MIKVSHLMEVHPGHTLLLIGAIGFVLGMFFTVWLVDQYWEEMIKEEIMANGKDAEHQDLK